MEYFCWDNTCKHTYDVQIERNEKNNVYIDKNIETNVENWKAEISTSITVFFSLNYSSSIGIAWSQMLSSMKTRRIAVISLIINQIVVLSMSLGSSLDISVQYRVISVLIFKMLGNSL